MKWMHFLLVAILATTAHAKDFELDDDAYQSAWSKAKAYDLPRVFFAADDVHEDKGDTPNQRFPFKFPGGRGTADGSITLRSPANPLAEQVGFENGVPVWRWPVGTAYFELHQLDDGKPFELRARIKIADSGPVAEQWEEARFRPIYDHEHLESLLGRRVPYRIEQRQAVAPRPADRNHFGNVNRKVAVIGDVDRAVLDQDVWRTSPGSWVEDAVDVTTESKESIVPRHYAGWMVADNCKSCHSAAGLRVAGDGLVAYRGGDQIFTDDPFHRESTESNVTTWDMSRVGTWKPGHEPFTYQNYTYYYYNQRGRRFRRR